MFSHMHIHLDALSAIQEDRFDISVLHSFLSFKRTFAISICIRISVTFSFVYYYNTQIFKFMYLLSIVMSPIRSLHFGSNFCRRPCVMRILLNCLKSISKEFGEDRTASHWLVSFEQIPT